MAGALALLRERSPEEHGRRFFRAVEDGGMNVKRLIGLDNLSSDYAYARGEETGYTSAKRIPATWWATTCGTWSVGWRMELGCGTNKYAGKTSLCMATAVSGYKLSFGSDGPPGAYEDLEKADVVLLIGANIAENHPILCQYLEANPHKTLIVADPRVTKTA